MVTEERPATAIVSFGGGPPRAHGAAPARRPPSGVRTASRTRTMARTRTTARMRTTALALLAAGALGACVRSTTITYLPSPERPRLSLAEGQTTLARYLGIECESLLGRSVASSRTSVLVLVDSLGNVTSSELERSTGDPQADGLVGAVTAQLRLDGVPAGAGRAVVRAAYRCAPEGGATATLLHP